MRHTPWLASVLAALLLCTLAGWFRPADEAIRDLRFALDSRPPTNSIVLVDIDPASLDAVGVWPWPRRVHADVLNRLLDLGASEVVFDVDFSQPSNPADDAAFEQALADAGGYARLAAFRQLPRAGRDPVSTLPLPRFRQHADPVAVNVATDGAGIVRTIPYGMLIEGVVVPSLPAALAGLRAQDESDFVIDYGIDATRIDRISIADLLAGRVASSRVEGRQVVIGASALELRDVMMTPRFGPLPGALIQILATDSIKQGRAFAPPDRGSSALLFAFIAAIALLLGRRLALSAGIAAMVVLAVVIETGAFVLQSRTGILVNTAGAQLASLAAVVFTLGYEAFEKRRLHRQAERERREALERLANLARFDALTGALTRHEFLTRVDAAIKKGSPVTLVAFSLTRFGRVGEALGHEVGDLVLKQVIERVHAIVPAELARIAGENFALMPTVDVEGLAIDALCASIRAALRSSFEAAGHQVVVGCRIGVTHVDPGAHINAETALRQAEMASSAAAQFSTQPLVVFEPAMEERINATRVMELALREALGRREIEVYFQAQVDLRSGMVIGAEALSRWHHPVLGTVAPPRFIAVAEETGLAVELGAAVVERACREAGRWSVPVRAAVNVSPSQFDLDDVPEMIEHYLEASGLAPNRLDI